MADREQIFEREKAVSPLSHKEIKEADERSSTTAKVVHEAIRLEGTEELERPSSSIRLVGRRGRADDGLLDARRGAACRRGCPTLRGAELVASFGYCLGFLFVTMGRQQLFTETTLTVMLPVLHKTHGPGDVARYWAIVFVANIFATLLFAGAASIPGLFQPEAVHAFTELGVKAVAPGFALVLLKAVFAGWLIALMVWLMPAASSAKFFVIVAVTWLISVAKFSHVIAGSIEGAFAAIQGAIGWDSYISASWCPH